MTPGDKGEAGGSGNRPGFPGFPMPGIKCIPARIWRKGFTEGDGHLHGSWRGAGGAAPEKGTGTSGCHPSTGREEADGHSKGCRELGDHSPHPLLGVPSLELPCSPLNNRPPQGTPGSSPAPSQLCPSHQCQPERMRHSRVGWRGRTRSWSGKGLLTAASSPRRNRDLSSQEPQPVGQGS